MARVKDAPKNAKQHTIYRLKDNTIVPGTTTITGVMDKPFLVPWANRLGLEGIKTTDYVDYLAQIGTLAHEIVSCHFKGVEADISDYTQKQLDLAENSALSYFEWEKGHEVEALLVETPLVSELLRYGGQIDCLARIDGVATLLDLKTGKAIYNEYFDQLAAYAYLLEENGWVGDFRKLPTMILRIGRDETEGFEVKKGINSERHFERFNVCRQLYELNKELK